MRRIGLPVLTTASMLLVCGALPGPAFGQAESSPFCRTGPRECENARTPKACRVQVQLAKAGGLCKVAKLEPRQQGGMSRHQVQLCSKDTVEWEFINRCGVHLELAIGNFRLDDVIVQRLIREDRKLTAEGLITEPRDDGDNGPFEGVRSVSVAHGKSGSVKFRVKAGAHTPRTYKYDILRVGPAGRFVMLDPEGEIYK